MKPPVAFAAFRSSNRIGSRGGLLMSCAVAAIATGGLAPQRASAQAFNADPATAVGNVSYNRGTPGIETVTVNAGDNAVINWTPNVAPNGSGNIDFLPNGNIATFEGPVGNNDFTVLNRIVSANPIEMNGRVISNAQSAAAGSGGKIWFYSPGGILVGSTAVFDVGSLLLTANSPGYDSDSGVPDGTFTASADSVAKVSIASGAQINALTDGNYVALIAPRVEQAGEVRVNGSAAYVAGEQVSMTINGGLFDISVDIGTTDSAGIDHSGTTRGISSNAISDDRSIYMVAVPKNEALTMLLSGDIGYTTATNASVANGQIILSAGHNTFVGDGNVIAFEQATSIDASIDIGPGTYRSRVQGIANTSLSAMATQGSIAFEDDIWFQARGQTMLSAQNENTLSVGGDAQLWSSGNGSGGQVTVVAQTDGSVTVAGDLDLQANGFGFGGGLGIGGIIDVNADGGDVSVGAINATAAGSAGVPDIEGGSSDAEGGNIRLHAANGGTLTSGNVVANARADGGYTNGFGDGIAGNGKGGTVFLQSETGGTIDINGFVQANADGEGGDVFQNGQQAGTGQGGTARISADGGSVDVSGNVFLTADGLGGDVTNPIDTSAIGGNGYGGSASMGTLTAGSTITAGDVFLNANGHGGDGFAGGSGYGGGQIVGETQSGFGAGVRTFAGTSMQLGNLNFNAVGTGGDATLGAGGDGGYAQGGTTYVQADSFIFGDPLTEVQGSSITAGTATLDSNAVGGIGGAGFSDGIEIFIDPGSGGSALGGTYTGGDSTGGAFVLADNRGSQLDLGNITLLATATGGMGGVGGLGEAGGFGGNATGGTANAGTYRPDLGNFDADAVVIYGDVFMDASATGGAGGASGPGGPGSGAGGNATGGGYCGAEFCGGALFGARGTVTTGSITMNARANGGSGSVGGNAVGGDSTLVVRGGETLDATGDVTLRTDATGGYGAGGNGGSAIGGWSGILVEDGLLTGGGRIGIESFAFGGDAGVGGLDGGTATGGTAVLQISQGGSVSALGEVALMTNAEGGDGDANGGDAFGGTSTLTLDDGALSAGSLRVAANGTGGTGGVTGGDGFGGEATVEISANGGDLDAATASVINAFGIGGAGLDNVGGLGGTGGFGGGGDSSFTIASALALGAAVDVDMGDLNMNATGEGGAGGDGTDGGDGGDGIGGTATLDLGTGPITMATLGTRTTGFGGDGGAASSGTGGDGGDATGGTGTLNVGAGATLTALAYGNANSSVGGIGGTGPTGGSGGFGAGGTGLATIDGVATFTQTANPVAGFVVTSFGGAGAGQIGGGAQGGTSDVQVSGSLSSGGTIQVTGRAQGGAGTAGTGGDASGGTASLDVTGSILNGSVFVGTTATGGDGTTAGGNATAGTSTASIAGSVNVTRMTVDASATGGNATTGDGGAGIGGTGFLFVPAAGVVNLADLDINSDGFGGDSTGGFGGDGTAGFARLNTNGTLTATGDVFLSSDGEGGDGFLGGGDGRGGGIIDATTGAALQLGGTTQILGSATARAAGEGGNSISGDGGLGQGGYARMSALTGSTSVTVNNVTIDSSGEGGFGLSGGDGIGGQNGGGFGGSLIQTLSGPGSLTLTGQSVVTSDGTGGASTLASGTGGDGIGGRSQIAAVNGPLTFASAEIRANGIGGAGAGTAGSGTGGNAHLVANNASLTGGALTMITNGTTQGGTIRIESMNGGSIDLASLNATANGGPFAGDVLIDVLSGATADFGNATLTANGGIPASGEDGIEVDIEGQLDAASLVLTSSDDIQINTLLGGQIIVAGTLEGDSLAVIKLADDGNAGLIQATTLDLDAFDITNTANLDVTNLRFATIADLDVGDLTLAGALTLQSSGGVTAGNLSAGTNASLTGGTGVTAGTIDAGGNIALSGGPVTTGNLTAGGQVSGNGSTLNLGVVDAGGAVNLIATNTLNTSDITTGANMNLTAPNGIQTGNLTAAQGVSALATNGPVATGTIDAGTAIALQAGTNVQTGAQTAGQSISLSAGGNITTGTLDAPTISLTLAGDFTTGDLIVDNTLLLNAGGNLTAGNISVGGDLSLIAGLDLVALDLAAGGDVALDAGGDLTTGAVLAGGGITGSAGGAATFGAMSADTTIDVSAGSDVSIGDADAGTSAAFTAGGLANFTGTVSAPTITVTSGDLNIAETGSLGAHGVTNLLTLNAVNSADVILGGDGTEAAAGQYQLQEDGELIADTVVLNAASNIRVLDADIDGSQTSDGGVSHVVLNTESSAFIEGQVNFTNASATDSLAINAGDQIQVITDNGGISITDSNGNLSGTLDLTAHDIWVADQATLDLIAANPSFEGVEDLLSVNNSAVDPAGNIQVGGLNVTMLGSSFLVQNTGSDTDLAGLTVGQGGLNIVNQGTDQATVVIYGRQQAADGSFITGDAFAESVDFTGDGGFSGSSGVNGCDVSGCLPDEPPVSGGAESILGPIGLMNDPASLISSDDDFANVPDEGDGSEEDDDEEEGDEDSGGVDAGKALINTSPVSLQPPIDAPVTSGADVPGGSN